MKKFLGIFVVVFIISCSKNPVPKPDNLLDDEVMTYSTLTDLTDD